MKVNRRRFLGTVAAIFCAPIVKLPEPVSSFTWTLRYASDPMPKLGDKTVSFGPGKWRVVGFKVMKNKIVLE